eukprot:gene25945-32455_t
MLRLALGELVEVADRAIEVEAEEVPTKYYLFNHMIVISLSFPGFDRGGGNSRSDTGRGGGGGRTSNFNGNSNGGGGYGGGSSNANPHMGQVGSVMALTSGRGMSDAEILAVINPPAAERDRSALVSRESYSMPGHAAWRMTPRIGRQLDAPHVVRTNHFEVDTSTIPGVIVQHHVHIYRMEKDDVSSTKDIASEEDPRVTISLLQLLRAKHPEWERLPRGPGAKLGFTYDGRSSLFTTMPLRLPDENDKGEPCSSDVIGLDNLDGDECKHRRYRVVLTQTTLVYTPTTPAEWRNADASVIRALDNSLFAFARNMQTMDSPAWHLIGSKIFSARAKGFDLAPAYQGMKGYFASLKSCLAGTVLVIDMSVNCFLASGAMPELMFTAAQYNNFNTFYADCCKNGGLNPRVINGINKIIKNAKIKLNHINHWRKARELGPPADHPDSVFVFEGKKVTVAQYFELMCKDPKQPQYKKALPLKPVLVPAELISVPGGQSRSQCMDAAMTASMIKIAAVKPDERVRYITEGDNSVTAGAGESIVNVLKRDPN